VEVIGRKGFSSKRSPLFLLFDHVSRLPPNPDFSPAASGSVLPQPSCWEGEEEGKSGSLVIIPSEENLEVTNEVFIAPNFNQDISILLL
jgi:hypothetical protein